MSNKEPNQRQVVPQQRQDASFNTVIDQIVQKLPILTSYIASILNQLGPAIHILWLTVPDERFPHHVGDRKK